MVCRFALGTNLGSSKTQRMAGFPNRDIYRDAKTTQNHHAIEEDKMGLFSFFKGGADVDDIEKMLKQELGEKIRNLKAEFHKQYNLVGLSGDCDSVATREKAILLAGNVKGVEKVNSRFLKAPEDAASPEPVAAITPEQLLEQPAEQPKMESEFYQIKSGDTLSKIAKQFYGNAGKYPVIFEANKEVIKDPDKIYPGQMIRIPKV